eukprot:13601009-Alexandrium_andersonii.AAC.1
MGSVSAGAATARGAADAYRKARKEAKGPSLSSLPAFRAEGLRIRWRCLRCDFIIEDQVGAQ